MIELLYKLHHYWIIQAKKNGSYEPEDLIQDIYLKLHEKINEIEDKIIVDGEVNKPYMIQIIKNACINSFKRKKIIVELPLNLSEETTYDHNRNEFIGNICEKVKNEVKKLSHQDSLVWQIHVVHGKSCRDVERETGMYYRTFAKKMQKVVSKVRDSVEQDYIKLKSGNYE